MTRIEGHVLIVEDIPPYAVTTLLEQLLATARSHGYYLDSSPTCTLELRLEGEDPRAFQQLKIDLFSKGIMIEVIEP